MVSALSFISSVFVKYVLKLDLHLFPAPELISLFYGCLIYVRLLTIVMLHKESLARYFTLTRQREKIKNMDWFFEHKENQIYEFVL